VAGSSSSNLDIAAAWATIATFGAVLLGGAVYAIGACWPLKLYVIKIRGLEDGRASTLTSFTAIISNRSRNAKTISDFALTSKPSWRKRGLSRKANFSAKPIESILDEEEGLTIGSHDSVVLEGTYPSDVLPRGFTDYVYVTAGPRPFFGRILDKTPPRYEGLLRDFKRQRDQEANQGGKPLGPPTAGRSSAGDWRPAIAVAPGDLDLLVTLSDGRPGWTAILVHRISNGSVRKVYDELVNGKEIVALEGVDQKTIDEATKFLQESAAELRIRRSTGDSRASLPPAPTPVSDSPIRPDPTHSP
jgi:hypothetical protein